MLIINGFPFLRTVLTPPTLPVMIDAPLLPKLINFSKGTKMQAARRFSIFSLTTGAEHSSPSIVMFARKWVSEIYHQVSTNHKM